MSANQQKQSNVKQHIALTEHYYGYRKMFLGELLYFGYDVAVAQSRALRVMSLVTELKAKGLKRWTPDALTTARTIAKREEATPLSNHTTAAPLKAEKAREHAPATTPPAPAPVKSTPVKPAPGVMLYDAIDAYAEYSKTDPTKLKDYGHRSRVLAQKRAIKNMPLADVGERELIGLVNYWKSKPSGTRCVYVGPTKTWKTITTGDAIGARTIKSNVGTARQMFRWFGSSVSGYKWSPPNLQPIFEMKNADVERLRTGAEKMLSVRALNDEAAEHFTLDELTNLWMAASNARRRLFFLLSLNAGFLTSELSALLVGHCFLNDKYADNPFVACNRPKTGVYGKWFLWPESAKELRSFLRPQYPYGWIDEEVEKNPKLYVVKGRVYQPTGNTSPRSVWDTEMTLTQWRKSRVDERERWEKSNARTDPEMPVFSTEDGNSLLTKSPNGHRNDAVKLVWARWSASARVNRLSWKNMRKTGSQLVRQAATDLGMSGDYMSELFLAHQAPMMSRPYNRRVDSEYEQLGRVLREVRTRLGKVFGDADENE